jgi:hypothetical protein
LFNRIATISLLTVLLFNWVGYWLFISWCEGRETARWESRLEREEYDREQLILFKVPAASIPYATASADFQRADGELETGNIHYRYVWKRLYNDSVEFLCVPDTEAGRLQQAKTEIIHLTTDGADGRGKSTPAGKINMPPLIAFFQPAPAFGICNFPARPVKVIHDQPLKPCAGHPRTGWQPPKWA